MLNSNVYIDFGIIMDSDIDSLKTELDMLIAAGKHVFAWHKTTSVEEMAYVAKTLGIYDYIWGYKVKDSVHYSGVDFIIDQSEKLVDRFKRQGVPGNVLWKL